ncbi:MAG TPA: protoporphyrinogen oxidase [Fimbriimonadaceae bacterium]|nr:protoporphyrinogen oxidase [Fimbriimonadaceae bacterium]
MKRVVVVGGGIAGLSAAYYLQKSPNIEVTLIEGSRRLGGKIGTERIGGFLIEQGPDSVFTAKPAAVELATELGMEDQFIEPQQHDFSILVNGRLFHVPRSLASLMPGAASALEKAEFFGASARKRILKEKDAPKGDGRDESIASFFRRRFGRKFSSLLAEPLLAGIHGGDPEKLSMKALYPTYLGLEQKKGSLTGPSEQMPASPQGRKAGFLSLRDGMASLVTTLRERLDGVRVIQGAEANRIEKTESGCRVYADGQRPIEADAIVLAVPAPVASCLLRDASPTARAKLLEIRHTSTAVVTFAYSASSFSKELHGNGFLVPYTEDCDMTGCTWSSNKWEGRAPAGQILIRCFMGRDGGLNVDDVDDAQLVEKAASALRKILHAREAPTFTQVKRWSKAMPQKVVGHTELLAEIESALEGLPVYLVGASYRSSGIPDCVRDGRDVAERIIGGSDEALSRA